MKFTLKHSTPLLITLLMASCSYHVDKHPQSAQGEITEPGFNDVSLQVLQPQCLRCHGAGSDLDLTDYKQTSVSRDLIKQAVESNRMPPGGGLSDRQKKLILSWIANGAPQQGGKPSPKPEPTPEPTPEPDPKPEPTHAWISKYLLDKKCTGCHSPKGKVNYIDLSNYEALMKSETVQAGDPGSSTLYQVLVSEDPTVRMPPKKTGMTVSEEEAKAVHQWILDGAKP